MPRRYCKLPDLTPQEIERFWSKVDRTPGLGPQGECWEWIGALGDNGCGMKYGRVTIRQRTYLTHRITHKLTHGDPDQLNVLHRCDNPPCCNPAHLFDGTHLENMLDAKEKGRTASGDRHGSVTHPERLARGDRNSSRLRPERLPRGEQTHFTKLTEAQVREILSKYTAQRGIITSLAREYGVSLAAISLIVHRINWKHVD